MIKEAIATISSGTSLSQQDASAVMEEIMSGSATPAQLGAFLTALSIKGETAEEIAGLAEVMRSKALQVKTKKPALDIVGTGGDGLNTFNISSASAIVCAAAGATVAKHGNRAATGKCGSADVLEALGVNISLSAEQVEKCIKKVGIGFMFAPVFHPAMKYAAPVRKEIGIRTVFNILGPLTNPARVEYQLLGVPTPELGEKIAETLARMKMKHAIVVTGENGMDEVSLCGSSTIWEILDGEIQSHRSIKPEDFGFEPCKIDKIAGGTAEENARMVNDIFDGVRGPHSDAVILNSAVALATAEMVSSMKEAVELAKQTVFSGKAMNKLSEFAEYTQQFKEN